MKSPASNQPMALLAGIAALTVGGCATEHYFDSRPRVLGPTQISGVPAPETARRLRMFNGDDGAALGWADVMDAVGWAEVIIIGEQHDDAVGHAVQRAIVEDTVARWPRMALSMEMLERDEQRLVDDYFDGIIDADQFARLTFSEKWAGEGSWAQWYQPMIDAAKDGGGRVVAANAPRRYVKLARKKGYAALDALSSSRRAFVDCPKDVPADGYRDRFFKLMTGMHASATPPNNQPPTEKPAPPQGMMHLARDNAFIEALFRSQLVWDATMAESIARAKRRGAHKVVHLVGQFHCDSEGGTVLELRRRLPGAKILVISMQRAWPDGMRQEDRGRADIVIYTGVKTPEQENADSPDHEAHTAGTMQTASSALSRNHAP